MQDAIDQEAGRQDSAEAEMEDLTDDEELGAMELEESQAEFIAHVASWVKTNIEIISRLQVAYACTSVLAAYGIDANVWATFSEIAICSSDTFRLI